VIKIVVVVHIFQALNWAAAEKVRLIEVSALDRQTLYEPFVYLASRLNPPPRSAAST
jgi:NF-kappa-B inhibitor-interacting Ras-like protein